MTGSAQTLSGGVRLYLLLGEKLKGEGLGEERARRWAGGEAGGFLFRVFWATVLHSFFRCLSGGHFFTLFMILVSPGSPK